MNSQAQRILTDIEELAPHIVARAAETEAGRRIPVDVIESLRSIGVFRMLVPRSHGGLELDLPAALDVLLALARIDGSLGWTVMIGSGGNLFLPWLPRDTYQEVYRNGPDVIFAGSSTPSGTAEVEARGWRVNGRWPFVSGCQHADWILAFCVVTEGGIPVRQFGSGAGPPLMRAVLLPACDWQIEDTWHVAGLKGTGSHHVALRDKVVRDANVFDIMDGTPCVPDPLAQALLQVLPLLHGAVCVGMAEGALDDLVALARTGRQQLRAAAPLRDSEIFQYELGRIATDVQAAQAFLKARAASHWRHALAGTLKDEGCLVEATQASVWLAATCVRIADACFALGGGNALYESSPLQRWLRDLHTAAQHSTGQQRHYVAAGKLLLAASA
jgi:indole-3-acetate monooxygenase